ncbi:MAG: hypothetical protein KGZ71_01370 [Desulfobulbaceae bacterium]|nr:hypothetical protein [Desulfobulbaceae bacterium]
MKDENEILLDFIDGNLSIEEEQTLFYELTVNDELRQKLKDLMAIEQTVSANPSFYAPTVNSTKAIFSQLGFTPPQTLITTASVLKVSTFMPFLKSLNFILPTLSLLLLSGVSYYALENNIFSSTDVLRELTSEKTKREIMFESNLPITEQYELAETNESSINSKSIEATKKLAKDESIFPQNLVNNSFDSQEQGSNERFSFTNNNDSSSSSYTFDISKSELMSNKDLSTLQFKNDNFSSIAFVEESFSIKDYNIYNRFSIVILKNHYAHTIKPTVEPSKNHDLRDISFSLRFKFNSDWSIGVFALNEAYFQKFDGFDEVGRKIDYEQQPLLQTIGTQIQYNYFITENLAVHPKILAGLNEGGFVAGIGTSMSYNIYSGISFEFGVELKRLFFRHNAENFGSTKYGLNYGIIYNIR